MAPENKQVDDWFARSFHGTTVSQDTPIYNAVHAAVEDLKDRLAAAGGNEAASPAAVVDQWAQDCIAGNSVLQRSDCEAPIAAAIEELRKLYA